MKEGRGAGGGRGRGAGGGRGTGGRGAGAAYQKSQPPQTAKASEKSPIQDLIDKSILEELQSQRYSDAERIFKRVKDKLGAVPDLDQQREIFKKLAVISELNKEISVLLDVYFSATPVKTVQDCEEFITTRLRKWMVNYKKTSGSYETFESFGIGCFRYNPKVMALFKFKKADAENLPSVSVVEIIQIFLDIVSSANMSSANTAKARASTVHQGGIVKKKDFDLPEGLTGGMIIGTDGKNRELLKELTGATHIKVSRGDPQVGIPLIADVIKKLSAN